MIDAVPPDASEAEQARLSSLADFFLQKSAEAERESFKSGFLGIQRAQRQRAVEMLASLKHPGDILETPEVSKATSAYVVRLRRELGKRLIELRNSTEYSQILDQAIGSLAGEIAKTVFARMPTITERLSRDIPDDQDLFPLSSFVTEASFDGSPILRHDKDGTHHFDGEKLEQSDNSQTSGNIEERLLKLLDCARSQDEATVRNLASRLFPDWGIVSHEVSAIVVPLPTAAPELYTGLRGPETPPEFVKRAYAPWLEHGLTRAHVRKLDPKLYTAIDNWLSRPGNEWPSDVDLPTVKEQNAREIAALRELAGDRPVSEVLGSFTAREASRIRSNINRHDGKRK